MKKLIIVIFLVHTFDSFCQNFDGPNRIIPSTLLPNNVIELDFDNDDDLDVLFYSRFENSLVWVEYENGEYHPHRKLNIGSQIPSGNNSSFGDPQLIVAADLNGDMQNEIVFAEKWPSDNALYRVYSIENNQLVLENSWLEEGWAYRELFIVDVDFDDKLDIVGTTGNEILWYKNEGSFQFSEASSLHMLPGYASNTGIVDIDSDGDMDIVSSSANIYNGKYDTVYELQTSLHINDGAFNFADTVISDDYSIVNMEFVDLDLNGDIDIIGHRYQYWGASDNLIVLINNGLNFIINEELESLSSDHFVVEDLDGDDHLDLIIFDKAYPGINLIGVQNDGTLQVEDTVHLGSFSLPPGSSVFSNRYHDQKNFSIFDRFGKHIINISDQGDNQYALKTIYKKVLKVHEVEQADLNSDGIYDIYIKTEEGLFELKNLGEGNWDIVRSVWDEEVISPFSFGDINGDGDDDLITKSIDETQILWYENLGDHFSSFGNPISINHQEIGMFCADDIDSDGHIDLIYAALEGSQSSIYVLMGQGQGDFLETDQISSIEALPEQLIIGDLDNDMSKDILTNKTETLLGIYTLNNEGQVFNEYEISQSNVDELLIVDLDNDELNDIVFVNNTQESIFGIKNLGNGEFDQEEIIYALVARNFSNLQCTDFDGDGFEDIIAFNFHETWEDIPEITFLRNIENFNFIPHHIDYAPYSNISNSVDRFTPFFEIMEISGSSSPDLFVATASILDNASDPSFSFANFDWFENEYLLTNVPQNYIEEFDVQLIPNPVNQVSILDLGELKYVRNISIIDAQGRLIKDIGQPNSNKVQIERGDMAKGLYFIRIETELKVLALKFIIE